MPTSDPRGQHQSFPRGGDRLPAAAGKAARDRDRLRASEAAVTSEVIEFQLARQRVGLRPVEDIEPLSPREQEVLALVAAGRTDGEIAEQLFISKKTASVHVANIKGKLAATSRVEIAMLAARLGLVDANAQPPAGEGQAGRGSRSRVICPFKGLASFDVADARFFFGRERIVAELVARLAGSTFVGVVGSSGSGKSSVVRAGLVPALTDGVLPGSEGWAVAILRPGGLPIAELGRALAAALRHGGLARSEETGVDGRLDALPTGARLLLVVDQFEEVFTLCESEDERAAFIRSIGSLARDPGRRALVLLAVRADFYGRCAEHRDLADLLGTNHVLVGPMTAEELARAIELPARAAGLRVEPELTAALVTDVVDEPGALPLLSTTLLDLWQRRDGRTMRFEPYERIGRVSGSVSRLAESAMERLTPDQQVVARAVFLRLAARGADDVVVRRPVPLAELDADRNPDVARVLAVLTDSRLLTLDDGTVEVAHEVLLREWPRLREWLEEDAEGRRLHEHLIRSAREWDAAGEDPAELFRGARLTATLDWAEAHEFELNDRERRFLAAGRAAGEREVEGQRRTNRRLRLLLAGAAGFLVLALVAGGAALGQLARAEQANALARARELSASGIAALGADPSLGKLLALSAASILDEPPREIVTALHEAWAEDRVVYRHEWPDDRLAEIWTDANPSGELVLATSGLFVPLPGYLEVFDTTTDSVAWTFDAGPGASLGFAFFTPDGEQVVAGVYRTDQGANDDVLGIYRWDGLTGNLVQRIPVGSCGGIVTAVARSSVLLRTSSSEPCFDLEEPIALELLALETGEREVLAENARLYPERGALTAEGRFVGFEEIRDGATTSVVLDADEGRRLVEIDALALDGQEDSYVRAVSEDGRLLLYGDRPMQLRDLSSGEVVDAFGGRSGATFHAAFSRDGRLIYSVGRDARLRVRNVATGTERMAVPGVGSGRLSILRDDRVLVSRVEIPSVSIVDVGIRGELGGIDTRGLGAYWEGADPALCLTLSGSLVALHDHVLFSDACSGPIGEATTQIVDTREMALRHSLPGGMGQGLAVSPDGTRFVRVEATGQDVRAPTIRDIATGLPLTELEGTCEYENSFDSGVGSGECVAFPERPFPLWPFGMTWSPDGSMIAAVDQGNGFFVAVWDARTGDLVLNEPLSAELMAYSATFSPDSRRLIVAYLGGIVESYTTDGWERLASVDLAPADALGIVGFSADGSTLHAVSGYAGPAGGALHWLDGATLQPTRSARDRIHEGSVKSYALSPDRSLIATGASDGLARIWSAGTGDLVQEISAGETEVQGVAFVDAKRLAMTRRDDGALRIFTLDAEELVRLARASLTRTYTEVECARYGLDPCPTLADLRGD